MAAGSGANNDGERGASGEGAEPMQVDGPGCGGTPEGSGTPSESDAEPDRVAELRHKRRGGGGGGQLAAAGRPAVAVGGSAVSVAGATGAAAGPDASEVGRRGQQAYKAFVQSTGQGRLGQARHLRLPLDCCAFLPTLLWYCMRCCSFA